MTASIQDTENGGDPNLDPAVQPYLQSHSNAYKAHYQIKKMRSAKKWR